MEVHQAIQKRRAYRSLISEVIPGNLIEDLARSARLAPSCSNNQPWRFVFVRSSKMLERMHEALSKGNAWAHAASMIIAVFSRVEDDCIIRDRIYHQFDCGLAAGFLILRATELGLVAHPIAGFSPKKTREILGIPEEYQVITLIIVGKRADQTNPILSEKQAAAEKKRPKRKRFSELVSIDRFEA
ncbi:MAG: nitroreductase family protein [Candidatus Aminicenantes bacterium]|nr:MAG: nitroreductase family protein [Candidatus Aminicenantes bacterium]